MLLYMQHSYASQSNRRLLGTEWLESKGRLKLDASSLRTDGSCVREGSAESLKECPDDDMCLIPEKGGKEIPASTNNIVHEKE